MLVNTFVINFPNIVTVDLEVEISVGTIDFEMGRGPEMARTGVTVVTDLIVIGVMADSGMVTGTVIVTGQIGPVTPTGETGSVTKVTGTMTLLTEERGTAMKKEEIDTMMKKEVMIKLGIVSDMTVREDVMKIGQERGRLMRLEIVNARKMTRKTEVATIAMKSNVTPGVVVRIIILSRNSKLPKKIKVLRKNVINFMCMCSLCTLCFCLALIVHFYGLTMWF